jgi:hypothetical protein
MGGLVAHAVMDVQNGVAAQPKRPPAQAQRSAGHSSMARAGAR